MNTRIFRLLVIMVAMVISSESAFSKPVRSNCDACEEAIFRETDVCLARSANATACVNQVLNIFGNCSRQVAGQCRNTQGQNLYDALATIRGTNAWNSDGIRVALAGTRNLPVAQAPVEAPAGGGGSGAAVGGVLLLGGAAAAAGLAAIAAGGLGSSGSGGGCGAGQASCGNTGVCCGDLQYYCPSDNSCGSVLRSCSSSMTACHN